MIRRGLPVCRVKSRITGSRLVSVPFATLCHPLAIRAADIGRLLDAALDFARGGASRYLEVGALHPRPAIAEERFGRSDRFKHHFITLGADLETIRRRFDRSASDSVSTARGRPASRQQPSLTRKACATFHLERGEGLARDCDRRSNGRFATCRVGVAGGSGTSFIITWAKRITVSQDGGRRMDGAKPALRPGDVVQVLEWAQLRRTLDGDGRLARLPFMPEMAGFCGNVFVVSRRGDTACDEIEGSIRKLDGTVYLDDLRCGGSDHGGCQKNCGLLWREEWLRKVEGGAQRTSVAEQPPLGAFPYPCVLAEGRYICQATELNGASSPLRWRDAGLIVRGWRANWGSPFEVASLLTAGAWARLLAATLGRPFRYLPGTLTRTPSARLGLVPGELVRVKTRAEIVATLDREGRNRGLQFSAEMASFCRGRYRVLGRLERMIDEHTGALVPLEDTVLLEGVVCSGRHVLRGGCPRANYYYWREIWLERVTPGD